MHGKVFTKYLKKKEMDKTNSILQKFKEESLPTKLSIFFNVLLYLLVSLVSMVHAYQFFLEATEPRYAFLAVLATITFELGQVACLFSLTTLGRSNKLTIWMLFIFLTFVQVISNIGYGYQNIDLNIDIYFKALYQFFSFSTFMVKYGKEIFTFAFSGSLPIIALLFIKSMMNYIAPTKNDIVDNKKEIKNELEEDDDGLKEEDDELENSE